MYKIYVNMSVCKLFLLGKCYNPYCPNEHFEKKEDNIMQLIRVYRYIQVALLILLFSFMIHFNYPIWHVVIVGAICLGIIFVTKMRSMAIGMYMGATDERLRHMIRYPFQLQNIKLEDPPEESDTDEDPFGKEFWMGNEEGEA